MAAAGTTATSAVAATAFAARAIANRARPAAIGRPSCVLRQSLATLPPRPKQAQQQLHLRLHQQQHQRHQLAQNPSLSPSLSPTLPVSHHLSPSRSMSGDRVARPGSVSASASSSSAAAAAAGASAAAAAPAAVEPAAASESDGLESQTQAKEDTGSVEGKTVIITGANTGMGLITAKELALKGANVVLACRSKVKGEKAVAEVNADLQKKGGSGSAVLAILDLGSLESVRQFVRQVEDTYPHVDRLINNAGIMVPPHSYTKDGFESQFQVNHLSHYLLTRLLLPSLERSPSKSSIIHISSLASENVSIEKGDFWRIARRTPAEYDAFTAYRHSKLAQVLFTVEMSRRLGNRVTVNAVHPGIVNTELFSRNSNPTINFVIDVLGKVMEAVGAVYTPEKGASTAIYLATTPSTVTSTGGYFADSAPRPANPVAFNRELGLEWWEESAKAAGIDP